MNPKEFVRGLGFLTATALPWFLLARFRDVLLAGAFALASKGGAL